MRPCRAHTGVMPGRAADLDSAHSGLLLDVFDRVLDFGLDLLLLAGEAISLVASDVADRFLGLTLELLGFCFDSACGGGGQGHGWGAKGEGS